MATQKRTTVYVLQDNWRNEGWKDFPPFFKSAKEASEVFEQMLLDHIWLGEGKRKWRLVRRVTNDYVEESQGS